MTTHYANEENVLLLIALMRHHGVRRVIASPGTTNIALVASLQQDSYFQVYSCVDERSAAYMACGMAAETGEAVALSCTGATASRNYLSGLTEAYYRKLPVLAITSTQHVSKVGNLVPQVIDRSSRPSDVCKISVHVPTIHCEEDREACRLAINKALIALGKGGGGPAHINLETSYSKDFSIEDLPVVAGIDSIDLLAELPSLSGRSVAVFVGAHRPFDHILTRAVDEFCAAYDAVVLCDHTSNYHGEYRVLGSPVLTQTRFKPPCSEVDVLVHMGEVSGAYLHLKDLKPREVWRVSPDGEARDLLGELRYVFDMGEREFFDLYAREAGNVSPKRSNLEKWIVEAERLRSKIPELPFSNAWCAQHMAPRIPNNAVLHLGILNTLRSWNMFEVNPTISCFCNTGGFGIDGCVSSLIGASLASPEKLCFGVVGDLACFYDLNSLGNRHMGSNIRLMVVNNGVGTEFKNYNHPAARFGEDADAYMAARGHFGNKSPDLLRHYATDLGFEYQSASSKDEFLEVMERFVDSNPHDKPLLFEVFTASEDESEAIRALNTLESSVSGMTKEVVKSVIGEKGVATIKKALGR